MRVIAPLAALLLAAVLALPPIGPELWLRWNLWSLRHRPDALYRRAERHYEAGDVAKARAFADAAWRKDPRHAATAALRTELDFADRRGSARSSGDEHYLQGGFPVVGCLIEIDVAYQRGTEAFQRGDLSGAERELRRIVEWAKWLPEGVELRARERQARDVLDRVAARREGR